MQYLMAIKNQLLRSLSIEDWRTIEPYMSSFPLKDRGVIYEVGELITHVYFIEDGAVSMTTENSGSLIETAIANCHGAVGAVAALGALNSLHRCRVLIAGSALRISSKDIIHIMERGHSIRPRLINNVLATLIHGSQNALCATHHGLEQRLSGWLTITLSALNGRSISITHQRLSEILGLRRAGLTDSLNRLENLGIIRKSRGLIHVMEPHKLRELACDCCRVIENGYCYQRDDHELKHTPAKIVGRASLGIQYAESVRLERK